MGAVTCSPAAQGASVHARSDAARVVIRRPRRGQFRGHGSPSSIACWLAPPGALVLATYACIWLRFGPCRFVVGPDAIEVVWPLKRWWRVARDGSSPCASLTREGFALRSATCGALRPQAPGRRHRTSSNRGQISIALCRRAVLYEAPWFASSNA
jgi:hypothetical protein